MAILQKIANELEARIAGTGLSVFFVKDIAKRPKVNTFFQNLATELNSRGITAQRIEQADNFDRGVLIVYDLRVLEIAGHLQKILDSQVIRFIITFTQEPDIEDFEKIREKEIQDVQGGITVQVWKRKKQRIL